jgi:hypothetical protein
MTLLASLGRLKMLLIGAIVFVVTLVGMYFAGKNSFFPFTNGWSKNALASNNSCNLPQSPESEEVYFVSCGGFF